VEGVAGVLDHLRRADGHQKQLRLDRLVEGGDGFGVLSAQRADHCEWRVVEVGDGCALAQEFRVDRQPEVFVHALARRLFQHRQHDLFRRAGQNRAANDHDVIRLLRDERLADLAGDAL
jgi:hypothetical protein